MFIHNVVFPIFYVCVLNGSRPKCEIEMTLTKEEVCDDWIKKECEGLATRKIYLCLMNLFVGCDSKRQPKVQILIISFKNQLFFSMSVFNDNLHHTLGSHCLGDPLPDISGIIPPQKRVWNVINERYRAPYYSSWKCNNACTKVFLTRKSEKTKPDQPNNLIGLHSISQIWANLD